MPQQLIYTSAPRGVVAGRSGHCTVARSAAMRDALILRLEQLSYYQHLSLTGGKERPILAYRIVDIRGSRFHVLSRIQDAGLDFTGRTNFIAHHLALAPEELRLLPTPPIILRDWPGWIRSWTAEPALLENEDWSALSSLARESAIPAQTWHRVTGDAANGYGLLEARAGSTFRVDDQTNETILGLFAESLDLLEVKDARRDFRAAALPYTFTTSLQEQDNPADFRWRCIHADNPAANRLAAPDCRDLSAVRANRLTEEEGAFARAGRQAPEFVVEPQDIKIMEDEIARFQVKASGVPIPSYQWLSIDRTRNAQPLADQTTSELTVANPPVGQSRYRVRATNGAGEVISRIAILAVEPKPRLPQPYVGTPLRIANPSHQKSEADIAKQRNQLEIEKQAKLDQQRKQLGKVLGIIVVVVAIPCVALLTPKGRSMYHSLFPISPAAPSTNLTIQIPASNEVIPPAKVARKSDGNLYGDSFLSDSFLSNGWRQISVGQVGGVHTRFNKNSVGLQVAATGLESNNDNFLFVCHTNDGRPFGATLATNLFPGNACAGIMVRDSPASNASYLFVGASAEEVFVCARTNGVSINNRIGPRPPGVPIILKLAPRGNDFEATYLVGKDTEAAVGHFASEGSALVGLAAWSGNPTTQVTASFVEVTPHKPK